MIKVHMNRIMGWSCVYHLLFRLRSLRGEHIEKSSRKVKSIPDRESSTDPTIQQGFVFCLESDMRFLFVLCLFITLSAPSAFAKGKVPLSTDKQQQLSKLGAKIETLETRVFRLSQQIRLISKKIFKGSFSVAKAELRIVHRNMMGGAFRLHAAKYWLNGKLIYQGKLGQPKWLQARQTIYQKNLNSGIYTIKVEYSVRGHGYGIFTYMKKFRAVLNNSFRYHVHRGGLTIIEAQIHDKGGRNLKNRLEVRYKKSFKLKK